jgi:hypothetical protein
VGEQCSNGESCLLFEALSLNRASPVSSGLSGIKNSCWGGEERARRVDTVEGFPFRVLLLFVIVGFIVEWIFTFCVALLIVVLLLVLLSTIESGTGDGDRNSVVLSGWFGVFLAKRLESSVVVKLFFGSVFSSDSKEKQAQATTKAKAHFFP